MLGDFEKRLAAGDAEGQHTYEALIKGDLSVLPPKHTEYLSVPLDLLDPWSDSKGRGQPFHAYSEEEMDEMVEDVKRRGLDQPILIRPVGSRYQILAGHNRKEACARAGLTRVEAKVFHGLTNDDAELIMLNTNLNQRRNLLPSELGWAYRQQLENIKRQGDRRDLTSGQSVQKLSIEVVADAAGKNYKTVQRYIKLTYLTPYLLEQVDKGAVQFMAGVALADLSAGHQEYLELLFATGTIKHITSSQGEEMKHFSAALDEKMIQRILGINSKSERNAVTTGTFKVRLPALPTGIKKKDICNDPVLAEKLEAVVQEYIRSKKDV